VQRQSTAGPGRLLLAFASAAERRRCAPERLLRTLGIHSSTLQTGLAAAALGQLRIPGGRISGLISAGVAGALDPKLTTGTILLPEVVITPAGECLAVDRGWQQQVRRRLAAHHQVISAPLLETPELLASPAAKQAAWARYGAAATDMESARLARWAAQQGWPFLVMRIVMDEADEQLPAWSDGAVRPDGKLALGAVLTALLSRPADWASLPHMMRQFARASARFRAALTLAAPALGEIRAPT